MKFVSMKPSKDPLKVIITVEVTHGWLWWKRVEIWEYIGNSTVWWTYPGFNRAETHIEARLADMQEKAEYEEKSNRHSKG